MKQALAIIEAPAHVCYRYRVQAFEPALRAAGWELTAQPLARGLPARMAQFWQASDYETVILQRKLLADWQLSLLRRRAKRLVFDFDDAVLYRDSHDKRGPNCKRRGQRFSRVVQAADLVVAGNEFLADCAVRKFARPDKVVLIPTCVEPGRYQTRDHDQTSRVGNLELVWLGSSSTLQGMEQAREVWELLGSKLPGLSLKQVSDRFVALGTIPIHEKRWRPVSEFEDLADSDVGVSWVPDDLWSRGKCGLKILQYQAAGLPVVTNPVGVHATMVRHAQHGFLASTPEEWLDALRTLRSDQVLRKEMGQAARVSVATHYSVSRWSQAFVQAITGGPGHVVDSNHGKCKVDQGSRHAPALHTGAQAGERQVPRREGTPR